MDNQIIFGVTDEQSGYKDEILLTNMSNRHGCITGATVNSRTRANGVLTGANA